ncbi:MAG: HAD family phosphatase [Candidatus Moraniibacteriota bacterium]|nr:MAG: HAD family phosphatase [Candidatus Moranbacteria bacterium]
MNEQKTKAAIFDIDGTIFRKNLHFELINELAWLKIFPSHVRKTLTDLYSRWLTHTGTYEDYRLALIDLYARFIRGCTPEDVARASKSVVPFRQRQTYIFAERIIRKLREENYLLFAISGSPIEIVEAYSRDYLHFDAAIGSVYEIGEDGRYTGVASYEPSRDKGTAARKLFERYNLSFPGSFGIGDTESDVKFLELVEHPIAFNPNENLRKEAEARGWRIVVEKKDVIYEIDTRCYRTLSGEGDALFR